MDREYEKPFRRWRSGKSQVRVLLKEANVWDHKLGGISLAPEASHYCCAWLDEIKPMEPWEKRLSSIKYLFIVFSLSVDNKVNTPTQLCSHLSDFLASLFLMPQSSYISWKMNLRILRCTACSIFHYPSLSSVATLSTSFLALCHSLLLAWTHWSMWSRVIWQDALCSTTLTIW